MDERCMMNSKRWWQKDSIHICTFDDHAAVSFNKIISVLGDRPSDPPCNVLLYIIEDNCQLQFASPCQLFLTSVEYHIKLLFFVSSFALTQSWFGTEWMTFMTYSFNWIYRSDVAWLHRYCFVILIAGDWFWSLIND